MLIIGRKMKMGLDYNLKCPRCGARPERNRISDLGKGKTSFYCPDSRCPVVRIEIIERQEFSTDDQ